jgi:hypothetical protein
VVIVRNAHYLSTVLPSGAVGTKHVVNVWTTQIAIGTINAVEYLIGNASERYVQTKAIQIVGV